MLTFCLCAQEHQWRVSELGSNHPSQGDWTHTHESKWQDPFWMWHTDPDPALAEYPLCHGRPGRKRGCALAPGLPRAQWYIFTIYILSLAKSQLFLPLLPDYKSPGDTHHFLPQSQPHCSQLCAYLCLSLRSFLEKEMATHSSILAWTIPWTGKPGGLQSMGSQRVAHDRATNTHTHTEELSQCHEPQVLHVCLAPPSGTDATAPNTRQLSRMPCSGPCPCCWVSRQGIPVDSTLGISTVFGVGCLTSSSLGDRCPYWWFLLAPAWPCWSGSPVSPSRCSWPGSAWSSCSQCCSSSSAASPQASKGFCCTGFRRISVCPCFRLGMVL